MHPLAREPACCGAHPRSGLNSVASLVAWQLADDVFDVACVEFVSWAVLLWLARFVDDYAWKGVGAEVC